MIINSCVYRGGVKSDIAVSDIREALLGDESFLWLGLYEPDEGLLREVQGQLGLHDLAVEDAHNAHQRPKIEFFGDSMFVVLRTAQKLGLGSEPGEAVRFGETHVFVGARYIVTVRHGASSPYTGVRTRCESAPAQLARGPGYPLYAILDFVVDNFVPIVDDLEDELEELEELIFRGEHRADTTLRMYELKREIVAIRRATTPLPEICGVLLRTENPLLPPAIQPYFRDVYDHVVRLNDTTETIREMLNTALSASLSLVSVRQNEVVKRLASWGAILAVPTLVASFYGMNFKNMPELYWEYGYPVVVGLCLSLCGLLFWRLKKAEWL